jgi:hypothetical protein
MQRAARQRAVPGDSPESTESDVTMSMGGQCHEVIIDD